MLKLAAGLAIGVAMLPSPVMADTDSARARSAAWLLKQQRGDGTWVAVDGALSIQATAAALRALRIAGLARAPAYGTGLAWMLNADADSIDAIARKVQALSGASVGSIAQREADRLFGLRAIGGETTWGGFGGAGIDLIDTALSLSALRVGDAAYTTKASSSGGNVLLVGFCQLANMRVVATAGRSAWSATPPVAGQSPETGRPSVVATALLAAEIRAMDQRLRFTGINCTSDTGVRFTVSMATVAAEAAIWLLDQQNTGDGGWGEQRSDGSNGPSSVLVTALVYQALISQATVPAQASAALSWLLAQQDAVNGSWRSDAFVTATVMAVLPSATGAQALDSDRDGLTDVVEAQTGSNASQADSRGALAPPTLAKPGVTLSAFNASATVGTVFSQTLGPGSGFAIASGALPPGITLSASTGQLSGIATQAGSYSFDYQFTAGGVNQLVIGRIDVTDKNSGNDAGEAPIPLWALLALGGSLAAAGRRLGPGRTRKAGDAKAMLIARPTSNTTEGQA
jgi:hypothetical protein